MSSPIKIPAIRSTGSLARLSALILTFTGIAGADVVDLFPTADAAVYSARPDQHLGDLTVLAVGVVAGAGSGGGVELQVPVQVLEKHVIRTLIQFDPAGALPPGAIVRKANLGIYQAASETAGGKALIVEQNLAPWIGSPVTWNNSPETQPVLMTTPSDAEGWIQIDVTEIVAGWMSGEHPNFGLTLAGDESALHFRRFNSEEAATERPHLRISWEYGFLRGDVDGSGDRNLTDALAILDLLFLSGAKIFCLKAADVNDDGAVGITDPIYLLDYLFYGHKQPPAPFAECGLDPTRDRLSCKDPLACSA